MKLFSFFLSFLFLINSNAQTITNYTTADGLLDNFVECINVDVDDNIWFGTSVGFQKYDPSTPDWTNFDIANYPGMVSENIKEIKLPNILSCGQFWIGTDFGAQLVQLILLG